MKTPELDYPIALKLSGKRVLLVGGGRIAEGRLTGLLEVGARVHVVAREATPAIHAHAQAGRIRLSERAWFPGDGRGAELVFVATNSRDVSREVAAEARAMGQWVNAADIPELCDFNVPSVGRRGVVTVAVSTAGQAPAVARLARQRALESVGPEFGVLARIFASLRQRLPGGPERARLLQGLLDRGLPELLATQNSRAARKLVRAGLARFRAATSVPSVKPARAPLRIDVTVNQTSKALSA